MCHKTLCILFFVIDSDDTEAQMESDVDKLSGTALAYEFLRTAYADSHFIGSPTGPIATYAEKQRRIYVFGGGEDAVRSLELETEGVNYILVACSAFDPLLHFEGGRVRCIMGSVTASAPTMQEAMMRAYLKAHREKEAVVSD